MTWKQRVGVLVLGGLLVSPSLGFAQLGIPPMDEHKMQQFMAAMQMMTTVIQAQQQALESCEKTGQKPSDCGAFQAALRQAEQQQRAFCQRYAIPAGQQGCPK